MSASPDEITLSLTGPASHTLRMLPGLGSLQIGPDVPVNAWGAVRVGADDVIDWSCFDQLRTAAGAPWPRVLTYHGDDPGFLAAFADRNIDAVYWYPTRGHEVDARAAQIDTLVIDVPDESLHVALPEQHALRMLNLRGRIEQFSANGSAPSRVTFVVPPGCGESAVRRGANGLEAAHHIQLEHGPLDEPLSLSVLRTWPQLTHLALSGSFSDFDVLTEFPELVGLELRFVPDLEGLPPLAAFPRLTTFIAFNVPQGAGRRFRTELRALAKARDFKSTSVAQLRTAEWFRTEYALPYSSWDRVLEKRAARAHRAAQKALAAASTSAEAEQALVRFITAFNRQPGVETAEREDLGAAVDMLVTPQHVTALIRSERAAELFDTHRDY